MPVQEMFYLKLILYRGTTMVDVIEAKHIIDYKIEITFSDSIRGIIDFSEYLDRRGLFKKLNDFDFFKNFRVNNEIGTICWENGLDISPETLYYKITGIKPEWMQSNS